jgi:hypothetical protein
VALRWLVGTVRALVVFSSTVMIKQLGGLDTVIKVSRQGTTEYFGVPWEGAM